METAAKWPPGRAQALCAAAPRAQAGRQAGRPGGRGPFARSSLTPAVPLPHTLLVQTALSARTLRALHAAVLSRLPEALSRAFRRTAVFPESALVGLHYISPSAVPGCFQASH